MALTAASFLTTNCGDELAVQYSSTNHPVDDLRLNYGQTRSMIDASDSSSVATRSILRFSADSVRRYHTFLSDEGPLIGTINDVVRVGPDSAIYLLDGQANRIFAFTAAGDTASVGRPGRGPGEFLFAHAIDKTSAGEILIADEALRLIVYRANRESNGLEYAETIELDVIPFDLCVVGDLGYAVLGVTLDGGQEAIHFFDKSGSRRWSSLTPYATDDMALRLYMAEGRVACGSDAVFVAFGRLGEIMRIERNGDVSWIASLDGYQPIMTRTIDDGRGTIVTGMDMGSEGYHSMLGLHYLDDKHLLVQVAWHTPIVEIANGDEIDSYLVDASTGSGNVITGFPSRRIGFMDRGHGIWVSEFPPDAGFFRYQIGRE